MGFSLGGLLKAAVPVAASFIPGVGPFAGPAAAALMGGASGAQASGKASQQQQESVRRAQAFLQQLMGGAEQRYQPYRGLGQTAMMNMGQMLGSPLPQSHSALGNVQRNYGPPPQLQGFTLQDLMQRGAMPAAGPSMPGGPMDTPSAMQWVQQNRPAAYAAMQAQPHDWEATRAWREGIRQARRGGM